MGRFFFFLGLSCIMFFLVLTVGPPGNLSQKSLPPPPDRDIAMHFFFPFCLFIFFFLELAVGQRGADLPGFPWTPFWCGIPNPFPKRNRVPFFLPPKISPPLGTGVVPCFYLRSLRPFPGSVPSCCPSNTCFPAVFFLTGKRLITLLSCFPHVSASPPPHVCFPPLSLGSVVTEHSCRFSPL